MARWIAGPALIAIISLSGCATLIDGSRQTINIVSEPPDAICLIGPYTVRTPAAISVPRNMSKWGPGSVTCRAPAFKDATAPLKYHVNPHWLGDILFGVIPPGLIDFYTGALWQFDPDVIRLQLEPAAPASAQR